MDSHTSIEWITFPGHSDHFQKPPLGGRPTRKPGDHGTPNAHNCLFYPSLSCAKTHANKKPSKPHSVASLVPYDVTLHSRARDRTTWFRRLPRDGLWTLSLGLSQSHCHGHGPWLVCKEATNPYHPSNPQNPNRGGTITSWHTFHGHRQDVAPGYIFRGGGGAEAPWIHSCWHPRK